MSKRIFTKSAASLIMAVSLFLCGNASAAAAPGIIKGQVTDASGQALAGVVVAVQGDISTGTQTDDNGNYTINVKDGSKALEFSCMGFVTAVENIGGRALINVILAEDNKILDEVVVVGYGTQKKVNLTGSVTAIDFASTAEKRTIISTSAALAGLAPGMQVTQSSGQPGSDAATIRIRGNGSFTSSSNSPLVLVDGVEWSMDNVNPNDIASISVLKDAASTAIYGTRAANGVILITTKSGSEGKPQISYSYKGIFQMPYSDLHFVSDYAQHMELINEACENMGKPHQFSQSNIDLWREKALDPNGLTENGVPNYAAYPNTDWFSEIFQTGYTQEHNVNISGGTKKVSYLVSAGYLDNQGVMGRFGIDSSTQKFNFRTNLQAEVTDWFTVGTRIFGQRQNYGLANVSNAFNSLYQTTPGVYPGDVNYWGIPALNAEESSNANNIFRQMYGNGGYNVTTRLNGTMFAHIRPYKGVSIEGTVNYSPSFGESHTYSRENGMWDYTTNTRYSTSSLENAGATNRTSRNYYLSSELLARYNGTFGDHDFGVLVGYSNMEYRTWGWGVGKQGATDWSLNELSTYETLLSSSNSAKAGWGLQSFFGRVNYSYLDRYLFEANFRADGSSRFGSNSRYGFFPSFSAGWKIHEENWMAGTKNWLSNLKLRASWGQTGNNQGIGNYAWQAVYATENVVIEGKPTKGLYISSLSNADLKWETTTTTDIGIDFGAFNNRLTADIDWYLKNTTDILYTPSIYMTMGDVSGVPSNLGSVMNTGVELALGWKDSIGKDFSWFANVNFAFNRNKVTKFKGDLVKEWVDGVYSNNLADVSASWGSGKLCEGHPLGEHYLRSVYRGTGKGYTGGEVDPNAGPVDGMIRTETDAAWVQAMLEAGYMFNGATSFKKDQLWYGDLIYADTDGDKNYGDDDDMNFNGHTDVPSYNLGINLGFAWKGFDFSMTWSGAFDFYIIWNAAYYNGSQMNNGHGLLQRIADNHYFYDPTNPADSRTNISGSYPRLTYENSLSNRLASEFYEYKGDYLKLKNVQLGYTLPEKLSKKFFVQQLRFFVSGDNLATFTSYPGLDPEKGNVIGYPLMRQVTLGAQITF